MGYSPREYRAIQCIALEHGYQLQLCRRPWVYYSDKQQAVVRKRISDVMAEYESLLKAAGRQKRLNAAHARRYML